MQKWLLKHRKIVTTGIILIATIIIFIGAVAFQMYRSLEYDLAESLYYSSQIVSAFFVISGVVIAIWQYYLSCNESKRNIDVICVQKAIDLSEYYKDNILAYMAPLRYIFDNSGISEILSNIKVTQIEHFDEKELQGFLKKDDIKKLKKKQEGKEFFKVVLNANYIYNLGLNEDLIKIYQNKENDTDLEPIDSEVLSTFLGKLITRVLNNMEYFSLHFTHNVADESVVYKSLHQTYIKLVWMLYYNIANANPLSPIKFYTNTIELYELWNTRATAEQENFASEVRKLSNKGTVVDN